MSDKNDYVKCMKCGWVHFSVSLKFALNEVHKFNEYFNSLSTEQQNKFYGGKGASIEDYSNCARCGNHYENFVFVTNQKEIPFGSTIGPIINPVETTEMI